MLNLYHTGHAKRSPGTRSPGTLIGFGMLRFLAAFLDRQATDAVLGQSPLLPILIASP